jgi:hypothetical protein
MEGCSDTEYVSQHHLPMALNSHESPILMANKDYGALQKESPLISVSKEALPIAADNQSNVDAMNSKTDIAQPLSDQKSSAIPSALTNDVLSQQEDTPGNAPATELQPSTSSTVLIQTNTSTIITNTAEHNDIEIDLNVRQSCARAQSYL